ncbi:unnamed protein product [Cuscuta campestris]|uniref:Uncharacterized protein n=1 Tax=Cuscuta campestris TaxID=132261 RepID=A0A484KAL2_9ASTE|nr:unnamed protein product [Cuscuta campestris]
MDSLLLNTDPIPFPQLMPMLVKAMDDLPRPLLLEILSRLGDQADLARCRVASKTLNAISRDLESLSFICTYDRYTKSLSPPACSSITPFKQIFLKLVSDLRIVKSVLIGIDISPLSTASLEDVGDKDDLYLTDVNFVEKWLPRLSECLKSVSISDFWLQSSRRRSSVLDLISSLYQNSRAKSMESIASHDSQCEKQNEAQNASITEESRVKSSSSRPKRKERSAPSTRSEVWAHFTRFTITKDDVLLHKARCDHCGREFAANTKSNGTSSLKPFKKLCELSS